MIPLPCPVLRDSETIEGWIIHIDRFGNLITNLTRSFVEQPFGQSPFLAEVQGKTVSQCVETYAEAAEGEAVCLYGSSNYLEISVRNGSARDMLGAQKGDIVILEQFSK